MLIEIQNPLNIIQEKSNLGAKGNAGEAFLTVRNNEGYAVNAYIIVGKLGEEITELRQVTSTTTAVGLNLTSSLSFSHGIGTPISVIGYNQFEISYRTSGSGSWSVLTTVDLEVDDLNTTYDHTQGQSTYQYRVRLYNATTGQYSDYSPTLFGTGFDSRSVKPMVDTVLRRLRDPKGEYNSRESVLQELIYQYEEITSRMIQASSEYYRRDVEVPTESFKYEYTLPDDFRELKEVHDGNDTLVEPIPANIALTKGVPGYELTDRDRIYFNNVPTPASGVVVPIVVHHCDSITVDGTWAVSNDATNLTVDSVEFKEGAASLNFDADVSLSSNNKVTLTNSTMTAQDLSDYDDDGHWRFWVYLPNVTYITSLSFSWGSSSANYWTLNKTTDYKQYALHDGWNLIDVAWADTNAVETGTVVSTAITYLAVSVNYSSAQDDLTDFRLDGIRIALTYDGNDVYRLTYFRQPAQLTNEMDQLDIPPGNSNLLLDGAIAALMIGYETRDTLSRDLLKRSDEKKNTFTSQSAKRTRRPIGPRPFGRNRNYSSAGTFRGVHTNYDVYFPPR